MSYLKHIEIDGVLEVGVDDVAKSNYHPTVEIVKVVDSDGNDWEPVPGPDPWDELVVSTATKYSAHNDYTPGVEVFGHVAGFTGGSDQTVYQYRWQYQTAANPGSWVAGGGWAAYNNNPVLEVGYTIPAEAEGGKVRLQSRARDENDDPVTQVMSNASAQTVAWLPVAVDQRTTTTGERFAGETLTGTLATFTNGEPPVNEEYQWQESDDGSGGWQGITDWTSTTTQSPATLTYKLTTGEVGKYVRFAGRATDAGGNIAYGSGNSVGPIMQYTVGTVTGYVDGVEYDPQATVDTVLQGSSNVLTVIASGNSPNLTYTWTVRQGDVRITPNGNMCTIVHQSEPPQGDQVQCDIIDNYASDDNKAIRFAFLVSE